MSVVKVISGRYLLIHAHNMRKTPNHCQIGVEAKKGRNDNAKVVPPVVSNAIEMLIMHALSDGQEVTSAAVTTSLKWGA